jgi:predicted amidophosphoribosyltransferase
MRFHLPVRASLDALAAAIWPERCPACEALLAAPGFCASCAESLYPLGVACPRCAEPEQGPVPVTCFRCLRRPPPFARATAPYRFGGELAAAVRRWKYGGPGESGRPELTRGLAACFAPALAAAAVDMDAIVTVPPEPTRMRHRGFAQVDRLVSAALACLGDRPAAPLLPQALRCTRQTADQAGLGPEARRANVRGAFAVPDAMVPLVEGRRILLCDDVMTTGATCGAAARALRRAGALEITVVTLGRAEA